MRLLLILCCFITLPPVSATTNHLNRASLSPHPFQKIVVQKTIQQQSGKYQPLLHASYLPVIDSTDFIRLKRKAKLAKWLGIGSLVGIFIPFVNIVALPAAVVGLILAGQVKKKHRIKGY